VIPAVFIASCSVMAEVPVVVIEAVVPPVLVVPSKHNFSGRGFTGGLGSPYLGEPLFFLARTEVPICLHCPSFRDDLGIIRSLQGPEVPVCECPGPFNPIPAAPVALAAAGPTTPGAKKQWELGDPLDRLVKKPLALTDAITAALKGGLTFIGDPAILPRGAAVADSGGSRSIPPWLKAMGMAKVEEMFLIRLLATGLVAAESKGPDLRWSDSLLQWEDLFSPGDIPGEHSVSVGEFVRFAFKLAARSLGRTVQSIRDKKRHAIHKLSDSDVKVRTAAGSSAGDFEDWLTNARNTAISNLEADFSDLIESGPGELPSSTEEDVAFTIGVVVAEKGFTKANQSRAWKRLDAIDASLRKEIQADNKDDIDQARKLAKERRLVETVASAVGVRYTQPTAWGRCWLTSPYGSRGCWIGRHQRQWWSRFCPGFG
jgi:hypothetical protein